MTFAAAGRTAAYYTVVGRAKAVTGPYVDRDGKAMTDGGGLLVLHADLDEGNASSAPDIMPSCAMARPTTSSITPMTNAQEASRPCASSDRMDTRRMAGGLVNRMTE